MATVFISYSHIDAKWAEKLAEALPQRGFDPFLDKESLRAGENWETQILDSLIACDHLIVLWSTNAQQSDWVTRERAFFDARRYVGKQRLPGHLIIHVLLDGTPSAYDSDQAVTDIQQAGAYVGGASAVSPAVWQNVIDRIADGLGDTSVPVSTAIVTVTNKYVTRHGVPAHELDRCVDFDYVPPGGRSLDQLLAAVRVARSDLADHYGAERQEWRPFGGQQSIREILDAVRNQLNSAPKAVPIRWLWVDNELLSNDQTKIKFAARKLASDLSLVVLDPVALYSRWVRDLLQNVEDCLANPHAIVVVLPAFPTPPEPKTHTDMVRQVFKKLVDQFYEELPMLEHAQCSIFTADDADIRRLVRATLRGFSSETQQRVANAFVGMPRR